MLISDGGDNASRMTFEEVIARTQASSALVYTVALPDHGGGRGNPKLLERLAHATGGEAFGPKDERRIKQTLVQIAQDVRQTYTLGYVSSNTARDGAFRQVRVAADAPDRRPLVIRTRDGYRAAGTPAVAPPPPALEVTSASHAIDVRTEAVAPGVHAYRIVVTNRSTRGLIALQYEVARGATRVAGGRRKSERNEPIAAAGRSYAFEIQPGSSIDRLAITALVWEDGAIEGDGVLAADERMLDIGKSIQLRHVLKLLHEFEERNGEPAVHAFRARATALTLTADVPLTDASRIGMQQVKDALMKDLDSVRARARRPAVGQLRDVDYRHDRGVRRMAGSDRRAVGSLRRTLHRYLGQCSSLSTVGIEVLRRQPRFEAGSSRRPLRVDHRIPRRVAVPAFDDHVLAEQALVGEPESKRGGARRLVEGVAFPLVAPVAKIVEDVARHQVIASVAPRVRCSAGVNRMLPTSMTRCAGSIRIRAARPTASPDARSTIA